jgi:DNA end-binding protein Ku
MPARSTFKGFLRLSLVTVPVRAATATVSEETIQLNQLHDECHNRVRYVKSCPVHGELQNEDIIKGYQYAKDQYVIIDNDELAKLRHESDKAIEIRGFVSGDEVDPMYFSGRTYYLLPDGPVGQKPYQLRAAAMEERGLYAIATAILTGREQLLVVRPIDGLLAMTVLTYYNKLRAPAEFEDEIVEADVTDQEKRLTDALVDASTISDFDLAAYEDEYTVTLKALIEAKVEGKEIIAAPEPEEPKVINLMEALKASVESAQAAAAGKKVAKLAETARETGTRSRVKTGTG